MYAEGAAFTGWRDPRCYHALLGRCQPCHDNNVSKPVKLTSRAKDLNHWSADGSTSGKDKAAIIKDCPWVDKVPGLKTWARAENKLRKMKRQSKIEEAELQSTMDDVF